MLNTIKHQIRPIVKRTYSRLCRIRYRKDTLSVICPDLPNDNLGDQAMVLAAKAELKRRNVPTTNYITTGPHFPAGFEENGIQLSDRHPFFVTDRSFTDECGLYRDFAKSRQLFVFGADVLDGNYSRNRYLRTFEAIRLAVKFGVPTKIIGFSISETPSDEAVSMLRELSHHIDLCPRDPVSLRRLEFLGVNNAQLSADAAFLMPPAEESELPERSRSFFQSHNGRVVGICLHSAFFEATGAPSYRYVAEAISELAELSQCGLLLVPHHPADIEHLQAINQELRSLGTTDAHCVNELPSAPVAKRLFSRCIHVLTSRMHVAIASLGSATPVTCFPYLGKFEGLFEHFDLKEGLISVRELPGASKQLANHLLERINSSNSIREHIEHQLPRVIELSRRNFELI